MTWAQASDSGQIPTCAFGPRRTQWTSGMGLRIKSSSAALDMARRGVRIQTRRTPRRAISGPLTPVTSGQSRSSVNNEPPSSATLTAMRHTPSKLVMRVRFPSPALMVSPQVSGILHFFSRYFYDARSGLRARSVPDGFGVLPVFLVPAFLASVKSLPVPAAIFWSRSRVACW